MKNIITFDKSFVDSARFILETEERIAKHDSDATFKLRMVGLLGEYAAARFLESKHGNQRMVIPVGVTSRLGISGDTLNCGDVVTVSSNNRSRIREVKVYEVKSILGMNSKPLIRADHVEKYLDQGVDHIITVNVKFNEEGAECRINSVESPSKIMDTWRFMRIAGGVEVYKEI